MTDEELDGFARAAAGLTASACRSALDRVSAVSAGPVLPALAELERLSGLASRIGRTIEAASTASLQGSADIAGEQCGASVVLLDELTRTASVQPVVDVRLEPDLDIPATPA